MFLLVPAYPGCPGSKAVKRLLLLLLCDMSVNYISYDDHWFGTRTVLGFKAANFLLCFDSVGCKGKGTFLPLTPRGSLPEQAREETHTHTHLTALFPGLPG